MNVQLDPMYAAQLVREDRDRSQQAAERYAALRAIRDARKAGASHHGLVARISALFNAGPRPIVKHA